MLLAGTGDDSTGESVSDERLAAATQFLEAWGNANAAYGRAMTAADVALLEDGFSADFAYLDATDASRDAYWDAVEAADAVYHGALDAADAVYETAEGAAYDRLYADFAEALTAYEDALSTASAAYAAAYGQGYEDYEAAVGAADSTRDEAYSAAESLLGLYYAAHEDARRQFEDDLDEAYEALGQAEAAAFGAAYAAEEAGDPDAWDAYYRAYGAAYTVFEKAEQAAWERRGQAERDAEPLYGSYWDALTAADAVFHEAVGAAADVRWRAEAEAWDRYNEAQTTAAAARDAAEDAARERMYAALGRAGRERDAAYEAAGEEWDEAEEEAHDVQAEANGTAAADWLITGLKAERTHAEAALTASSAWWRKVASAALDAALVSFTPPADGPAPEDLVTGPPADGSGEDGSEDDGSAEDGPPADGVAAEATVSAGADRAGRPDPNRRGETRDGSGESGEASPPRVDFDVYFKPFIPNNGRYAESSPRNKYDPYTGITVVGGGELRYAYTQLTPEMQCLVLYCGGDPEREAAIKEVLQKVHDTHGINRMYWLVSNRSEYTKEGGFCGWWVGKALAKFGGGTTVSLADGNVVIEEFNVNNRGGGTIVTARNWLGWGTAVGSMTGHTVLKVTVRRPDGREEVMYADIGSGSPQGSFGGDDHWFFPDDPDWLRLMDVPLTPESEDHDHDDDE